MVRLIYACFVGRKVNQTIRGDSVADGINGSGWKLPITTGYHSLENECTSTTKGIDGSHDHYDDDDIYPDSISKSTLKDGLRPQQSGISARHSRNGPAPMHQLVGPAHHSRIINLYIMYIYVSYACRPISVTIPAPAVYSRLSWLVWPAPRGIAIY